MDSDSANFKPPNLLLQTDTEVFHALKAGESSALGILYDRYSSLVYRLALRILTNPQEAEDLTQEVFLTFWRSNSYNPARGSMSSNAPQIAC
jgi:RNA polymerase sigma-70 factor (ECF subfamily)